ncbi:MAG: PDZ domain-containing protein, partial [Coriobacteriales bacterium]|nr:PDZ domain-containing protein [Coriobacteriales bacterium]
MSYPQNISENAGALIAAVEPGSPAARAGLEPGMRVLSVDGEFLRDILDWHWLTDGSEIELEVGIEKGAGGLADKRGRTVWHGGWGPAKHTLRTSPFVSH